MHFPNRFHLNRCSERSTLIKHVWEILCQRQYGMFLTVGLLRAFIMLISTGNFQEVKICTQVVPQIVLTVESGFMALWVGLGFYRTGVEKM